MSNLGQPNRRSTPRGRNARPAPTGSGNISASVSLLAGGSITFTAVASISSAATGTLVNAATVAAPGGTTDPNPVNNTATASVAARTTNPSEDDDASAVSFDTPS